MDKVLLVLHVLAALLVIAALAAVGRLGARLVGQPAVIGEIAAGLLTGPALVVSLGPKTTSVLLPDEVVAIAAVFGEAGLALLLLGVARGLLWGADPSSGRGIAWVVVGASLPALAAGAALMSWIAGVGPESVRGDAPTGALVVFGAVATAVSAVPVLIRIVEERALTGTAAGRYAVAAAVAVDGLGWVLLALALGLDQDRPVAAFSVVARIAALVLLAVLTRRLLGRLDIVRRLVGRRPRLVGWLVGAAVVAAGLATEAWGLTLILGAVVFGLALPGGPDWDHALAAPERLGRRLVPVFFFVTGLVVLAPVAQSPPWGLVVATILLATTAKLVGGFLGARAAGLRPLDAFRVGALLNTRGLTEIVFLQAGLAAGLLTPSLFFVFVLMALATTLLTGPLLAAADRLDRRPAHPPVASTAAVAAGEPRPPLEESHR